MWKMRLKKATEFSAWLMANVGPSTNTREGPLPTPPPLPLSLSPPFSLPSSINVTVSLLLGNQVGPQTSRKHGKRWQSLSHSKGLAWPCSWPWGSVRWRKRFGKKAGFSGWPSSVNTETVDVSVAEINTWALKIILSGQEKPLAGIWLSSRILFWSLAVSMPFSPLCTASQGQTFPLPILRLHSAHVPQRQGPAAFRCLSPELSPQLCWDPIPACSLAKWAPETRLFLSSGPGHRD